MREGGYSATESSCGGCTGGCLCWLLAPALIFSLHPQAAKETVNLVCILLTVFTGFLIASRMLHYARSSAANDLVWWGLTTILWAAFVIFAGFLPTL